MNVLLNVLFLPSFPTISMGHTQTYQSDDITIFFLTLRHLIIFCHIIDVGKFSKLNFALYLWCRVFPWLCACAWLCCQPTSAVCAKIMLGSTSLHGTWFLISQRGNLWAFTLTQIDVSILLWIAWVCACVLKNMFTTFYKECMSLYTGNDMNFHEIYPTQCKT